MRARVVPVVRLGCNNSGCNVEEPGESLSRDNLVDWARYTCKGKMGASAGTEANVLVLCLCDHHTSHVRPRDHIAPFVDITRVRQCRVVGHKLAVVEESCNDRIASVLDLDKSGPTIVVDNVGFAIPRLCGKPRESQETVELSKSHDDHTHIIIPGKHVGG